MTDLKYLMCLVMRGKEIISKLNIERRFRSVGMQDALKKVVVPVLNGDEILYPGYVMVRMVMNDDTVNVLRKSPGILNVFIKDSIRDEEINNIKRSMMVYHGEIVKNRFSVGDAVVIKDGSFNNMKGRVSTVLSNGKRIIVDVKIFGRVIPMNVDSSVLSMDDNP